MSINISYYLDEYGWSSCYFYTANKIYEVSITHIHSEDPIEECIDALIGIMNGESERNFSWYGEPDGNQISIQEISTEKHKVNFRVISFSDEYGKHTNNLEIKFEIKKIQLIRMFYFEFKKIFELMKDSHFKENRKNCFPFEKFHKFELIALEYINLK